VSDTAKPIVHVAGITLMVDGVYTRQVCSWCGALLVDADLQRVQRIDDGSSPPQFGVPTFQVGAFVRVEGQWPTSYSIVEAEEGKYPPGTCFEAQVPRLRVVDDGSP